MDSKDFLHGSILYQARKTSIFLPVVLEPKINKKNIIRVIEKYCLLN